MTQSEVSDRRRLSDLSCTVHRHYCPSHVPVQTDFRRYFCYISPKKLKLTSIIYNGWLIEFYGTAAQYRLYSAGGCSECENECACRVVGVVPPCTLEQWVNFPPIPLGCVPSSTGSNHSTLSGSGHILSSP